MRPARSLLTASPRGFIVGALLITLMAAAPPKPPVSEPHIAILNSIGNLTLPSNLELNSNLQKGPDFSVYTIEYAGSHTPLLKIYIGNQPNFDLRRPPQIVQIGPCAGLLEERAYNSTINGDHHEGYQWEFLMRLFGPDGETDSFPQFVHFFLLGDGASEGTVELAKSIVDSLKLTDHKCQKLL
jgi:hypothetical protein